MKQWVYHFLWDLCNLYSLVWEMWTGCRNRSRIHMCMHPFRINVDLSNCFISVQGCSEAWRRHSSCEGSCKSKVSRMSFSLYQHLWRTSSCVTKEYLLVCVAYWYVRIAKYVLVWHLLSCEPHSVVNHAFQKAAGYMYPQRFWSPTRRIAKMKRYKSPGSDEIPTTDWSRRWNITF
jgi:hypothetical protein